MTIKTHTSLLRGSSAAAIFAGFGPRIALEGPNEGGSGGGDGETPEAKAAREAAEAAAAAAAKKDKPTDADAKLLKENMKFKDDLKKAQDALKAFEGINLDEVKQLLADKKTAADAAVAAEQAALEAKGEFDRVKQMMVEAHKTELTSVQTQLAELQEAAKGYTNTIDDLTIGAAFAGSKYVGEELVLTPTKARVVYGAHFERKDGAIVAFDKPKGAGDRTELVGGDGKPLKFEDALKKLVETDPDRDALVKSKTVPGAGSKTTSQTPTPKAGEVRGLSRIQGILG